MLPAIGIMVTNLELRVKRSLLDNSEKLTVQPNKNLNLVLIYKINTVVRRKGNLKNNNHIVKKVWYIPVKREEKR